MPCIRTNLLAKDLGRDVGFKLHGCDELRKTVPMYRKRRTTTNDAKLGWRFISDHALAAVPGQWQSGLGWK